MDVVAKMRCKSKLDQPGGQSIALECVADAKGKYAEYFAATPWGGCSFGVLSPAAAEQFVPGAVYTVTFSREESA